jgi:hypothetical protein
VKVKAVQEELQKKEDLSVCSEASKMELVSALWVKSRCGCGMVIIQEPRKGNVCRYKLVPEEWRGTADWEDQARV